MSPLPEILLLLIVAKALGELMEIAGFPSLIGEIAAGALLGPAVLGLVLPNETLDIFADIGIIALLFMSGAQLNLRTFAKSEKPGTATAIAGVVIPLVLGLAIGMFSGMDCTGALFLGIALSITSIGISVRTLIDLRQLKSDIGLTIVSAAVIDDVIGIVMLVVLASIASGQGYGPGILVTVAVTILFFVLLLSFGKKVIIWSFEKARRAHTHEMPYSVAVIIAMATAVIAHWAGLHYAIGAFVAGLILGDSIRNDRSLYDSLSDFAFGFFVTLFFASIGLFFPPSLEGIFSPFLLVILVAAFAGKILGGYLGSVWFMKERRSALMVGIGLCPRGEIALVIAKISLVTGIISAALFSTVTVMVIVTIFITPVLMMKGFAAFDASKYAPPPAGGK